MNRHSARFGQAAPSRGPSYDPEVPVPGCYRIRLTRGGPPVEQVIRDARRSNAGDGYLGRLAA